MKPYSQTVSKDSSAEVIWKNITQTLKKQKWKNTNEKELYTVFSQSRKTHN